jgi:plastocyanin
MRMLLTLPLTLLLIGCGSDSKTDTAVTKTVAIHDFKFGPAITVAPGAKVTWTNADSAPHNVVGDAFKTKDLQKGDSDTVTFAKAGSYDYVCKFHPFMKGTVIVK